MTTIARKSTILWIALPLSLLISAIILISLVTVLSGFSELEEKNAVKNLARAQEIIANRLNEISIKISDWAGWDELYYFINDKNEAFRKSNLTYVTLESLKLDNMVFLDSKLNVVSSILDERFLASDSNHQAVMPGLEKFFHSHDPFVSHQLPQEVTDGIVVLPSGPTLLVSRPIVKSDFSGPINGTVLFARSLDDKELDSMGNLLQAKLEILRVDQITEGSNFEKAHKEFLDGKQFSIQPIDSEQISGFTRLREKTGRQDLILKVTMPREIMKFGHHTLSIFIPALLFVGVCFALAVYLPLDREISGRVEIEKELLVLKNRFEQVSDFSREIIWEVDSRGMYTYLSQSVKDCLGYTSEELVNQRYFYELHPEEGREEFKKNVFLIFSKKEPFFNLENCALTRDGRSVWLITNGLPILDSNGVLVGYRGSDFDISDRKQNEILLLKAKEEAEAATRAKGYFLANMSHEIRTPMNAILGFTSLLSNTSMDAKQKDFLAIVQKSGKLLQEVINNILDLSKFENFQFSLEEIDFNLSDLCNDAMKISQTRIEDKQIATSIEIGPEVPEVLIGDPTRIQQILVNLLNNAIKFTNSGSISLKVNLEQTLPEQKVEIKFRVIDTGLGIPSDKISMIFNPFTQIDETITRKFGGTGLGLSICKAIVEKYGGKIEVISELHKGSEFVFNLVLRVKEQIVESSCMTEAGNTAAEDPGKPRLKILVAEDETSNKKLMSEYLKILGHDCVFAENGQEAVDQARSQNFSLCFMDLQMPEMDGFTATEIIRREISTNLPIIALSASVMQKDRENCTRVGMNGYLAKPVFLENLQSCIEQFCIDLK